MERRAGTASVRAIWRPGQAGGRGPRGPQRSSSRSSVSGRRRGPSCRAPGGRQPRCGVHRGRPHTQPRRCGPGRIGPGAEASRIWMPHEADQPRKTTSSRSPRAAPSLERLQAHRGQGRESRVRQHLLVALRRVDDHTVNSGPHSSIRRPATSRPWPGRSQPTIRLVPSSLSRPGSPGRRRRGDGGRGGGKRAGAGGWAATQMSLSVAWPTSANGLDPDDAVGLVARPLDPEHHLAVRPEGTVVPIAMVPLQMPSPENRNLPRDQLSRPPLSQLCMSRFQSSLSEGGELAGVDNRPRRRAIKGLLPRSGRRARPTRSVRGGWAGDRIPYIRLPLPPRNPTRAARECRMTST